LFIFFLVRKWAAFFLIQALQAVGKASFLRQARLLRRHSGSRDSATRRLDRDTRMTALLDRAMETVFFRDRLVQAGVACGPHTQAELAREGCGLEFFSKLTPIGKQEIRSRFPEGVLTKDTQDGRTYRSTSGTSGERLTVVNNFSRREAGRASTLHVLEVATKRSLGVSITDIPPNACNSVCGLEGPPETSVLRHIRRGLRNGSWRSNKFRSDLNGLFARRLMFKQDILPPLDARSASDLSKQMEETWGLLETGRPYLLRAFPQYLLWLSEYKAQRSVGSHYLKYVMPYGGLACDSLFSRVRSALGVETRNIYGTSELGSVAVSCDNHRAMHIIESFFEVEIFRDGKVVQDGQIGEVVITDLTNTAMPLIRYKVGDVGRILQDACACGRNTKRLEILGRVQETLVRSSHWVTASDIGNIAYSDRGVSNFRLDQISTNHFELQIVPSFFGVSPDVDSIRSRMEDLLSVGGTEPTKITPRILPFVQPEPNGKYLTCRLRPSAWVQ
jgi:phenylacetate-coenzyme A ligase PaaK-like adenylate-forming protein